VSQASRTKRGPPRKTCSKAKAVVLQLVDELGFDAVDAGGLDDSWRQQPGTPVYTTEGCGALIDE
jgi:predicted dinucleotide-binding enzyme